MHGASALASAALTEAEEIRQDEARLRAVATEWLADPTAASADVGHDGISALASMAALAARLEQRGKCRHGVSRFCASVRVDEKSRTRLDATLGSLYPAYFRKVLAPTDDGAVLDTHTSKVIPPSPLPASCIMNVHTGVVLRASPPGYTTATTRCTCSSRAPRRRRRRRRRRSHRRRQCGDRNPRAYVAVSH